MEGPERCDVYSSGTHERCHQVFCANCYGGAKLYVSCEKIVCVKCGSSNRAGLRRRCRSLGNATDATEVALIRDFGKRPRQSPPQPALHDPRPWAIFAVSLSKRSLFGGRMARRLQRIPDYFTEEEAVALVDAAPSYPTRMAFRIMLRTGLRVSEALALRRVDLRLDQDPPIIVVRADSPGNKARKGREVPVPADLVECLRDLASFHSKDHYRSMLDISRQRIGQVMKEAAVQAGIDPARAHPHALRHTYGRNCVLRGVPIPVLQKWLGHASMVDTQRYVELAGAHHEWVSRL